MKKENQVVSKYSSGIWQDTSDRALFWQSNYAEEHFKADALRGFCLNVMEAELTR